MIANFTFLVVFLLGINSIHAQMSKEFIGREEKILTKPFKTLQKSLFHFDYVEGDYHRSLGCSDVELHLTASFYIAKTPISNSLLSNFLNLSKNKFPDVLQNNTDLKISFEEGKFVLDRRFKNEAALIHDKHLVIALIKWINEKGKSICKNNIECYILDYPEKDFRLFRLMTSRENLYYNKKEGTKKLRTLWIEEDENKTNSGKAIWIVKNRCGKYRKSQFDF